MRMAVLQEAQAAKGWALASPVARSVQVAELKLAQISWEVLLAGPAAT
jgi:hypothetical protein